MTAPTTPAPAAPAAPPAAAPAAPVTPPPAAEAKSAIGEAGAEATTPEAKPPETKPAETKPAEKPVETKPAEFVAPKGFEAQADVLKKSIEELGLTGEKAAKFAENVVAIDAARQKQADDTFAAQDAKWQAELKADPEIGGAKFPGAMKDVTRALRHFGGTPTGDSKVSPLAALIHRAGLGNHPVVLKAFAAVGRALADDTISGTSKAAPPATERLSDAEVLYGKPTTTKEQ